MPNTTQTLENVNLILTHPVVLFSNLVYSHVAMSIQIQVYPPPK